MNEAHNLCLLLAVLYLSDCLWWLRHDSGAIEQQWPGGRWRLRTPPSWAAGRKGRFLALAPLPAGVAVQWDPPAFSLSPEGCAAWSPQHWASTPPPRQPWAVRWEEVDSIEIRESATYVNGRRLQSFPLLAGARRLARLLEALRQAPVAERDALLLNAWHAQSDLAAITDRLQETERQVRPLRWIGAALYVWMLLAAPAILTFLGGWLILVALAAGCLALVIANVVVFVRRHRELYPEDRWARRETAAVMCVSWPRAARGADLVSRHRLEGFHPFAVLVTLPAAEGRTALLGQALRDAAFPIGLGSLDPLPREIAAWQSAFHHRAFQQLARDAGLDLDPTLPPSSIDPLAEAYCPRCLADYSQARSQCARCLGIPLRPIPPQPQPTRSP